MIKALSLIVVYLIITITTIVVFLIQSFSKIPTKENIKLLKEKGIFIDSHLKVHKKSTYKKCFSIATINIPLYVFYICVINNFDFEGFNSQEINTMIVTSLFIIALLIIVFSLIIYFNRKKGFNNNNLKYIINNIPDDLYEMVYLDIKRNKIDI